jgi:uncharacterized membrane protein (DUF373 family)
MSVQPADGSGVSYGRRPATPLLRILVTAEYILLYLVSFVLLAIGIGVLIYTVVIIARHRSSWTETFISVIEALLLILIITEIFLTVLAHLEGHRLQLEPFILVGIIALVRHILSVVVRLAIPETPEERRDQLLELSINAGAAFLLVAALALARRSQRWGND